jgi:quercetin dioxygenase-like cupin family protein
VVAHTELMQKLSLDALSREQLAAASAASSGRSARTVYGGQEHVLRQTVIALTAGSSLSEHDNPGDATILVLSGRVRLTAGTVDWEGREGDLLLVPSARHSLLAVEAATILLSVASNPNAAAGRPTTQDEHSRISAWT